MNALLFFIHKIKRTRAFPFLILCARLDLSAFLFAFCKMFNADFRT